MVAGRRRAGAVVAASCSAAVVLAGCSSSTIDLTTGFITPVSTGWSKPAGLLFVPGT